MNNIERAMLYSLWGWWMMEKSKEYTLFFGGLVGFVGIVATVQGLYYFYLFGKELFKSKTPTP